MTGEELFLQDVAYYNQPYIVYKATLVPDEVRHFITLFRKLCIEGGRIPVPVIALAQEDDVFLNARARTASKNGITYQVLLVKPVATQKTLLAWVEECHWKLTDSVIRFACHEARHFLQHRNIVSCWHGKQWLNKWLDRHYQGIFCHKGALVYDQQALIQHSDRFLRPSVSRKQRHKQRAREHDAEATAMACAACWQMTYSLQEVTKLLHG